MAYETGTSTSLADLITKLNTFAVANGWTSDEINTGTGRMAMHRGNIFVSFRWNTTTPLNLGVYQALGFTGGGDPGTHPNDSGNGAVSNVNTVLDDERYVDIGNGAFPSYFFFESDFYIHVAVERTADVFRHFGFGTLVKFGDNWTGGEYCYGQHVQSQDPVTTSGTNLLDGLFSQGTNRERSATLHCEGLPGQSGSSKWAEVSDFVTAPANDTGGNSRILVNGGYRSGPISRQFGVYFAGQTSGLIPTYAIGCFYRRIATGDCYYLGHMPDVRGINMKFFAPKEEVTIGSDVWTIIPQSQKTASAVTDRSYNAGIAYKKVLT